MKILGCDTSTDHAVFFTFDTATNALHSIEFAHERDLSRRFYTAMDSCLTSAGLMFSEIDAYAVGVGPGSFTGVRVGVTTFRTFAQTTGKPLVGISTMDIFASSVSVLLENNRLLIVLPSRKNELYAGWYDHLGRAVGGAFVTPIATLGSLVDGGNIVIAGRTDLLPGAPSGHRRVEIRVPPVESFTRMAVNALHSATTTAYEQVLPLYVAPPAISQHRK